MRKKAKHNNEHILLRNKPDPGTALGQCVALGIVSCYFIPMCMVIVEEVGPFAFVDYAMVLFVIPSLLIIFALLIEIYWGFLGSEIVYYSDTHLYIQQKQSYRRDMVLSWDCITHIEPYDEPILYLLLPTHDPTICLHYKTNQGKSKKFRFGYHLSPKQREIVIDRIQNLLVESFA